MPPFQTYYEILEIPRTAAEEDIRRAYRRLALRWHPDKNQNDPSASEKFKEINHAYEVLSDSEKRREYDYEAERGSNADTRRSTYQDNMTGNFRFQHQFHDPAEIFNQFFGTNSPFASTGLFAAPDNDIFSNFQPRRRYASMSSPFTRDPFFTDLAGRPSRSNFFDENPFFGFSGMGGGFSQSISSSSSRGYGGVSESRSTRIVNGQMETVVTRYDGQTETVIETSSDGRRKVTVNGIVTEQIEPNVGPIRVENRRGIRTRAVTDAPLPSFHRSAGAGYRTGNRNNRGDFLSDSSIPYVADLASNTSGSSRMSIDSEGPKNTPGINAANPIDLTNDEDEENQKHHHKHHNLVEFAKHATDNVKHAFADIFHHHHHNASSPSSSDPHT